ncbi:hypothetical protein [Pontibacter vulgaris]|uniref:hypothetical protein n=1 Tax=Pontibacter vulgaris TaxID=2905679 RepID=UPI001FA740EC|nr:hypothetical protein [Pontibacter vulgaris]
MAALEADNLNSEFFRNFLPETIYLVPGEETFVQSPETAITADILTPEKEPVSGQIPEPVVLPATAIPKLPKIKVEAPAAYESIGNDAKGLVVLVTLPEPAFIALPKSEFLQRILQAIGYQIADVLFVNNVSGKVVVFEELAAAYKVNYIISFASRLDTALPHDKFTLYKPVVVGEVPVVFSQSLEVLDKDQEQKKHLWNALKQVFL